MSDECAEGKLPAADVGNTNGVCCPQQVSLAMPVFLDQQLVEKHIDVEEIHEGLERALANFSRGKHGGIFQPVRSSIPVGSQNGMFFVMPAFSSHDNALATKLVSVFPNNTHIATHQAVIVLNDPSDGRVQAVMDGGVITDIRTAVASAIATKHLTSSPKVLAILGAGAQAKSHFDVFSKFFQLSETRVWSRTFSKVETFAQSVGAIACKTAEDAVKNADVIITVTMSRTPVLRKEWVKPGAHINCVGAPRPDWQELDPELVRDSVVYCDSREAAMKEAGDIILSKADVYAEIGEVINGTKEVVKDRTSIFKSLGIAIEDVVSAKLVYDRYIQHNK